MGDASKPTRDGEAAAPEEGTSGALEGIAGSPGLAIGPVVVVDTRRVGIPRRHVAPEVFDTEMARFDAAVKLASQGLRDLAAKARSSPASAEASILEAYILMVEDEALREAAERFVRKERQCAEWALEGAVNELAGRLRKGGDAYLAERSHDIEFIGDRIQRAFSGSERAMSLPDLEEPCIVVAHDLSPAETSGLAKGRVLAIVTEVGTRTTHTAILARALEIPAVVGVTGVLSRLGDVDLILVDGFKGRVVLSPSEEVRSAAVARAERHNAISRGLHELKDRPAQTACGVPIQVRGNIELPSETPIALGEGAQGIGLYRTEFLYVDRAQLPTEDEQYEIYTQVLKMAAPLPVTLRTFDIGGDKFVSAFQAPDEMNPALGLRAVRLGLSRPDLFLEQLRAMVRASVHGELLVMIPMISTLRELRAVKNLLRRAIAEVDEADQPRAQHIPLGVMIEVPSAAMMADELSSEAEFLSIGTNDLIQYSLAVDRTSRELAYLASPFDPAILRLIQRVIDAGQQNHRSVAVCGAMASDPLAAVMLVGMGLRELSMEASAIPVVKEAIARVSVEEAERVVNETRRYNDASEIEQSIAAVLAPKLSDLLDADGQ